MVKYRKLPVAFLVLLCVVSLASTLNIQPANATTVTYQVSVGTDDCWKGWNGTGWDWYTNKLDNEAGYWSATDYMEGGGYRFQNIAVPVNATITSAYMQYWCGPYGINFTSLNCYARISGEDIDSSTTFSTVADFDGRVHTTAEIDWNNIEPWYNNNWYNSPNIASVVQEIVNRAGWASGNNITLFREDFDDRSAHVNFNARECYAYERAAATAPKLVITYTVASGDVYGFNFYGPFSEETGLAVTGNVTVSVWTSTVGTPFAQFSFNTSVGYNTSATILFFQFTFDDNTTREYWVDPSESHTSTIYVFKAASTSYIINFMDTSGILDTYPYITVKRYINGTLFTVEKRKVDTYNSITANLITGRTYQIVLGNQDVSYTFGDLLMTGTTAVQLNVQGVDFPKETLLKQKYVRVYAYRNSSTNPNSVVVVFEDTQNLTTSVDVAVNYADLSNAYNTTFYSQSFSFQWYNAVVNTTYQVVATVHHSTYGDLIFKQILPATLIASPPFSLAWLGPSWAFNSAYLLPAFLILFGAGCFSTLNAEVGAVLMCIFAVLLTYIGWIPIPAGSLVASFTFAILMALIAHKRRIYTG